MSRYLVGNTSVGSVGATPISVNNGYPRVGPIMPSYGISESSTMGRIPRGYGTTASTQVLYSANSQEKLAVGIEELNKRLALYPGDLNCLLSRAMIYEKMGKNNAALADYQQALALYPGNLTAQTGVNLLTVLD